MTEPIAPVLAPSRSVYFPKGTQKVGTDIAMRAQVVIYGPSGSGKTHLGRQLLLAPDFGPEEVLFLVREDVTSIYGADAHTIMVDKMDDAKGVVQDLLAAADCGERLPKVLFTDSVSGLCHGTQAHYREKPIEEWNEKRQMLVRNKFAEFGELGTQTIDFMLLAGKLPMLKIMLCTTWEPKNGPPELAVEGQMVPKFLTQMATAALYIKQSALFVPRANAEEAKKKGTLEQSHRIVVPWTDQDEQVTIIDRHLYSQAAGEVITKGHHSLAVKEKADLPAILRKMVGLKGGGK
jgi:hypothetical protein